MLTRFSAESNGRSTLFAGYSWPDTTPHLGSSPLSKIIDADELDAQELSPRWLMERFPWAVPRVGLDGRLCFDINELLGE